MTRERSLAGYAPDHPAFEGHFPGNPIVPGVLLLDAALHTLCAEAGPAPTALRIDSVKFTGAVRPGQPLSLRLDSSAGGGVRFTLSHGDRTVATGSCSARCADGA